MEMDTADIIFQGNNLSSEINLLGTSSHCYKCSYKLIGSVNASVDKLPVTGLDTRWPFLFLLQSGKHTIKKTFHMKEYGKYVLNLTAKSAVDFKIDFILENDPMNSLFPFFMFLAVLAGLAVVWPLSKCIYRAVKKMKSNEANYFMEMEEWENKIDSLSRQSVNNRAENGAPKSQWSFCKETLVEYQSDHKKFDPMRNLMQLEVELATRNLRFTIQHAKVASPLF